MKIALVASLYAPRIVGGAERVAQSQAEALAARGHTVHVLTLGAPRSGIVRTMLNGVEVIRVGIDNAYLPGFAESHTWTKVTWHARDVYNFGMARAARELLAELRPDAVVCHNVYGWSAAIWPAVKSLGLPLVQVLHDQYLRCVRSNMFTTHRCTASCFSCRLMRLPHRRLSRLPDAVVGVSRFVIDSLAHAGYFREVPIRTYIHNASHIDTRSIAVPARQGEDIVFGFIGLLNAGKGIELLLAAFAAIAQPHWHLVIAGSGEADYVQRLRAAHSDGRITFLGRQDPKTFYSRVDVTVVPSLLEEALGNVVFESLIHGRPVIGSRLGGIPEMLREGASGLLFDPAEKDGLSSAMRRFSAEIDAWRSRQANIQAEAASQYCDLQAWITRWEALLLQVAGRRYSVEKGAL